MGRKKVILAAATRSLSSVIKDVEHIAPLCQGPVRGDAI